MVLLRRCGAERARRRPPGRVQGGTEERALIGVFRAPAHRRRKVSLGVVRRATRLVGPLLNPDAGKFTKNTSPAGKASSTRHTGTGWMVVSLPISTSFLFAIAPSLASSNPLSFKTLNYLRLVHPCCSSSRRQKVGQHPMSPPWSSTGAWMRWCGGSARRWN